MSEKIRKHKDINQRAKFIVDVATVSNLPLPKQADNRNPAAVALGKLGGAKGGKARSANLTPEKRQEIAKLAAQVRWKKKY